MISNFRKTIIVITTTILLYSCQKNVDRVNNSDMVDINGNSYPTTSIGSQIWAAQNLDVNRYRNEDIIPHITNDSVWATLTTGAWCYYNNDSTLGKTYGKLYNHFAVTDPRGLSPEGWRVGSDSDWHTLSNYLGGDSTSGLKLKDMGTDGCGFKSLSGGGRGDAGASVLIGELSEYWTSDSVWINNACSNWTWKCIGGAATIFSQPMTNASLDKLYLGHTIRFYGLSVRCVKN